MLLKWKKSLMVALLSLMLTSLAAIPVSAGADAESAIDPDCLVPIEGNTGWFGDWEGLKDIWQMPQWPTTPIEPPVVEQPSEKPPVVEETPGQEEQPTVEPPVVEEKPGLEKPEAPSASAWELAVLDLVNVERAKAGLGALQYDAKVSEVARAKSADMRDVGYFDHQSPTYGSPFDMMTRFGVSYSSAGENIAAGQTSPQEVMQAWMDSPGHRANILNASYTHLGIGLVEGGSYGYYWTQMFVGR